MSEHDPFNEPETAHPRARELMREEYFWNCANDLAPFGSDEGWTAYYEWRDWREQNPNSSITKCLDWILGGRLTDYNSDLVREDKIMADIEKPDGAFLFEQYDMFTLDATIIATCLGQLIDEGKIESGAKSYLGVAIARQQHPLVCRYDERKRILDGIQDVANLA